MTAIAVIADGIMAVEASLTMTGSIKSDTDLTHFKVPWDECF